MRDIEAGKIFILYALMKKIISFRFKRYTFLTLITEYNQEANKFRKFYLFLIFEAKTRNYNFVFDAGVNIEIGFQIGTEIPYINRSGLYAGDLSLFKDRNVNTILNQSY